MSRRRIYRFSHHDLWTSLLVLLVAVGAVCLSAVCYFRIAFPSVKVLRSRFPQVHYLGPSQPAHVELVRRRPQSWVSLSQVSKVAVGAIVVSEDWAFYQHKGYDPNQITEALKKDLKRGRFVRGASTITQQMVKNIFLDQDKNLWRKVKEVILAVRVEEVLSKNKILEIYLNIAEWGEGMYGVGAASQFYFNKAPSQLSAKEGAFLAMLLPSPKRYSQSFFNKHLTEYAQETIESILEKMVQAGYLAEPEMVQQKGIPLSFEASVPPVK